MRVLQVVSVILPLVCLFGYEAAAQGAGSPGPNGRPMVTSNVNCAGEYLACMEYENTNNPGGMVTVSKRCKDKIRGLPVCKGHQQYDPSQLQGPPEYKQYGKK